MVKLGPIEIIQESSSHITNQAARLTHKKNQTLNRQTKHLEFAYLPAMQPKVKSRLCRWVWILQAQKFDMEFWEWWFRERDLLIEKCAPIFMFHVIHEFFIPKRLEDFQVFALPGLKTTWSNLWVEKVPNWLLQNLSKQSTSWDWDTLPLFWRKGFFILQKKRLKNTNQRVYM